MMHVMYNSLQRAAFVICPGIHQRRRVAGDGAGSSVAAASEGCRRARSGRAGKDRHRRIAMNGRAGAMGRRIGWLASLTSSNVKISKRVDRRRRTACSG